MISRRDYCQFCQILNKKKDNNLVIAQDQLCFAFHDLNKATSQAHILVCTKEHIESALHVQDTKMLQIMQKFGQKVLHDLYYGMFQKQAERKQFRMGFHLPPHISVFHIHLHCLILPITNRMNDKYLYGYAIKSAEEVRQRIETKKMSKL